MVGTIDIYCCENKLTATTAAATTTTTTTLTSLHRLLVTAVVQPETVVAAVHHVVANCKFQLTHSEDFCTMMTIRKVLEQHDFINII